MNRRINSIMDLLHKVVPSTAQLNPSLDPQPLGIAAQHHVALPVQTLMTHQLGYNPVEDPRSHTRVLGATVEEDTIRKIRRFFFIELGVLSKSAPSPSAAATSQLMGCSHIPTAPPKPVQPSSFSEWLDLFLIYMTIRMGQSPAEGPALTTYVARIKELSRREPIAVWLAYDREHRKLKAVEPELSWTKVHYDLLYPCQPATSQEEHVIQPFSVATGGPPPPGTCAPFYFKGWCDKISTCPQNHLCGHCKQPGHALFKCFTHKKRQGKPRSTFSSKPF